MRIVLFMIFFWNRRRPNGVGTLVRCYLPQFNRLLKTFISTSLKYYSTSTILTAAGHSGRERAASD
jgi:hypothetical protein